MQLTATLSDGSTMTHATSPAWSRRQGPITYDHLWHGEIYDARLELPTWGTGTRAHTARSGAHTSNASNVNATAAAAAEGWMPAVAMTPKVGALVPQLIAPIRVIESYQAQSLVFSTTGCSSKYTGGIAQEGDTLTMGCVLPTATIASIDFVAYGTPTGDCDTGYTAGKCSAPNAKYRARVL
jgi:hypothetical protein